jgi:hypothetical protein
MKHRKLLEDGKYTVFEILVDGAPRKSTNRRCQIFLVLWIVTTWALFAGLLIAISKVPGTTWVSLATCIIFTGWSMVLRLVEYLNVIPATGRNDHITDPNAPDAIFVMGRSSAAFVLEGSRRDVKNWTSRGLTYRDRPLGIPPFVWQGFTRRGSLVILLCIFSAISNGSTVDQVAFILLNVVAQLNVLIGQRFNSRCVLSRLSQVEDTKEVTRTHIYAKLIRRYREAEDDNQWVAASGILPRTDTWDSWKLRVGANTEEDPKELYREISNDLKLERRASIVTKGNSG